MITILCIQINLLNSLPQQFSLVGIEKDQENIFKSKVFIV